jgi:predicted nucleic acid-binding protein
LRSIVLDASVGAKWIPLFSHEPLVAKAIDFHDRWNAGALHIWIPDFFWIEIASILWKSVRRGVTGATEAETALTDLQAQGLSMVSTAALVNKALTIGIKHGRSVYDCLYVALADSSNSELITADEKLANALASHYPIKWLGAT